MESATATAGQALTRLRVEAGYRRRFAERHRFEDRSRGARRLLIVLAGHKPVLWPWVLPRIARHAPPDADVCLVTPGVDRPALAALAREQGWSYLTTSGGHVSVAQNLAIRAHPRAELIWKVDEDVFVPPGFFESLLAGYERVAALGEFRLGFAAPVLNVNGFSYVDYLRHIGGAAEYGERFGPLRRAAAGIPAHNDGEAAVFLWSHGLPVDRTAERFAARDFGFSTVPQRFSIGAILFERSMWDEMSAFRRREKAPGLGDDEEHICVECLSRSRVMVVLDQVYAGHFAYGPQTPAMERTYGERLAEF